MTETFRQFVKGSKLRSRFIFFFIILAVLPILLLGGVSLYLIEISHRNSVSQLELQLIDQKIEEIEKFLADTLGILDLRVGFEQKSEIELSQQFFLLEGILAENRAFEEVSLINLNGLETAKRGRGFEAAELQDVSELDKFKIAANGGSYIGGVYYTLSGPGVTLASPVINRNGDIIQILSAEVDLSHLARSVQRARLGNTGYLALFDKNGSLAAYKREENAGLGEDMSDVERVRRVLGGDVLNGLEKEDIYFSFLSSEAVVGAGKRVPATGWGILAEWPIEDSDAVIHDIRNQVVLFALIGIFAVLLLAPLFAWRLEGPIRKLEKGARDIERGNFDKKVEIKTGDELEDLGKAFNKMAIGLKRLEELREEFVFIAAHELRSPVTVIKGYASMVLEKSETLGEDIKGYLREINSANNRLAQLVEDLLEVARSEAGRINIKIKEVDIRVPVRESANELKPLADAKSISISYESPETMPNVLADSDRVKEIVVNLAGNAIKYTGEGGYVKIYHEIKRDSVITHIEDNGFGIAKEAQARMFEKFYRVQTKETANIQGTGLGLFIAKQIVEKMGGRIWFESKKGKGSTFSFSINKNGSRRKEKINTDN